MRAYVVSRLAQTALVVFLSLTAVFAMVRLSGDPVLHYMTCRTIESPKSGAAAHRVWTNLAEEFGELCRRYAQKRFTRYSPQVRKHPRDVRHSMGKIFACEWNFHE